MSADTNISLCDSDMVSNEMRLYFLAERAMEMKDNYNVMPILAEMLNVKNNRSSPRPRHDN